MNTEETIVNVILDAARGTVRTPSVEKTVGAPFGELPEPTRSGYLFDGWYLGEEKITPETVLTDDRDLTLTAKWQKQTGSAVRSALKKQKIGIVVLSVVAVLLIAALLIVNEVISVYSLTDTYYDSEGNEYTEKYYVKKKNGAYALYNSDGDLMPVNQDGYYIADKSGNLYKVDAESGSFSLYAVVDRYDTGEEIGFGARVMMFPQITQQDVYSIEVHNSNGTYTVIRDRMSGTAYLAGREKELEYFGTTTLDATAFANLAVSCGYPLTLQKLDSDAVPRLSDGSVDYSEYGLADTDGYAYYTIKRKAKDSFTAGTGENDSYTVRIGDQLLSGGGYYAKLEGRDTVYIVGTDVANVAVGTAEDMVTPTAVYPMTATNYLYIDLFGLYRPTMTPAETYAYLSGANRDLTPYLEGHEVINFSFSPIEDRLYTLRATLPFTTTSDLPAGATLDTDHCSDVLQSLYLFTNSKCVKLGITEEAMKEFFFNGEDAAGEVRYLSYQFEKIDEGLGFSGISVKKGDVYTYSGGTYTADRAGILVTAVAEYGCASGLLQPTDLILSVGGTEVASMTDLAAVLSAVGKDGKLLYPEGSAVPVEYMRDGTRYSATLYRIGYTIVSNDLIIKKNENGNYYVASRLYDMIVEADSYYFGFVDEDPSAWYYQYLYPSANLAYLTEMQVIGKGGKSYAFTFDNSASEQNSSDKIKVYSGTDLAHQSLMDQNVIRTTVSDIGETITTTVSASENFRNFYLNLLFLSAESRIDEEELAKMEKTIDEYKAMDDSECDLIIYYRMENELLEYKEDADGNPTKTVSRHIYEHVSKVLRVYRYSGHALVTIDTLDDTYVSKDSGSTTVTKIPKVELADWQTITDPKSAVGEFYVLSSYATKILDDAAKLVGGEYVVPAA